MGSITQLRRDVARPTVSPAEATLLEIIRRCRHRIRLVLFLRQAAFIASAIAIILAAVVYLRPSSSHVLYVWLGAAASLISAAAVAWWRTPTARETAMELDRRLSLEDGVVAALQVQGSSAAVAPLIVRDVLLRLTDVRPGQVFPFDSRTPAALMTISMTLLLLATLPDRSSAPRARASGAAVASSSDATPIDPAAQRQNAPSGERPASAQAASEQSQSRGAADAARAPSDEPADRTTTSPAERKDETPSPDAAGLTPVPAGTRARDAATRAAERGPSAIPGAGESGGGSASRGSSGGLGGSTAGGAGASGLNLASEASGSGGIRGGTLTGPQGARPLPTATQPGFAARIREARQRAETALARDEVPPHLRSYIHDYFLAIQSPERK
jgi:uncharacterized membrane protein YgcG